MPALAYLFAWSVVAFGTALAMAAALLWQSGDPMVLLCCLGAAALASTFKVPLPGVSGSVSPGFAFLMLAVGRMSWPETVAIAIASALVQALWRPKRRPTALQVAFSSAAVALSGGLAFAVAHGVLPGDNLPPLALLGLSGLSLLVTNTMLVSTIVCLVSRQPIFTMWRSLQPRVAPYYFAGGIMAGPWSAAGSMTPSLAVLAAVSLYVLTLWYRDTLGGAS